MSGSFIELILNKGFAVAEIDKTVQISLNRDGLGFAKRRRKYFSSWCKKNLPGLCFITVCQSQDNSWYSSLMAKVQVRNQSNATSHKTGAPAQILLVSLTTTTTTVFVRIILFSLHSLDCFFQVQEHYACVWQSDTSNKKTIFWPIVSWQSLSICIQ